MVVSVSKFKNSYPKSPKNLGVFLELPVKAYETNFGNSIVCNTEKIYFSLGDGKVGFFHHYEYGRKCFNCPNLVASSNIALSLAATHLDSSLFASGCESQGVNIWKEKPNTPLKFDLHCTFSDNKDKLKSLWFHPCTPEVLGYSSANGLTFSNIVTKNRIAEYKNLKNVINFSWKDDGAMVVCVDESGNFHVVDPRTSETPIKFNKNIKNTKVIWAGMNDLVMAFGCDSTSRKSFVWDIRQTSQIWSEVCLDSSTGHLFPIYDSDTNIISISSKGSSSVFFLELDANGLSIPRSDKLEEASYGYYMANRKSLNVMNCEILRVYQLGKSSIIPISYHVTRKSYSTFYPELFPDAYDTIASIDAEKYIAGVNVQKNRISLNPKASSVSEENSNSKPSETEMKEEPSWNIPLCFIDKELYSKFTYIKGEKFHCSLNHDAISTADPKTPIESTGFAVYKDTMAFPLVGTSGKMGILKLSKPGRIAPTGPNFVENGSPVIDFDIDKKDDNLLCCICEDTSINVWKIPSDGLDSNVTQCDDKMSTSKRRFNMLRFHPCVKSVLSTSGYDGLIYLWDIEKKSELLSCVAARDRDILSMNWNTEGSLLCSVTNDKMIHIIDPRSSKTNISGEGFAGISAARVVFLDEQTLFCSGFTSQGKRLIGLKDVRKMNDFINITDLDVAPSVLTPYYDADTKIIYLAARGETIITPVEFRNDANPLSILARYRSMEPHLGISMLRKDTCNVMNVELARFVRLLQTHTENVYFTVPRTRTELFQDDIFVPTLKVWESSMSASEWQAKKNKLQARFDLQPKNTKKLSEAETVTNKASKYDSRRELELSRQKASQETDNNVLNL